MKKKKKDNAGPCKIFKSKYCYILLEFYNCIEFCGVR